MMGVAGHIHLIIARSTSEHTSIMAPRAQDSLSQRRNLRHSNQA